MLHGAPRMVVPLLCLCSLLSAADPPALWLDVPFVKQEKDGCGAASVAMVIQYWQRQQGRTSDGGAEAAEAYRALYSKAAQGTYASELKHYLARRGFQTFAFRGGLEDLQQHLGKGRPLIVAIQPDGRSPRHYVVVVGLDGQAELVMVNDPARRKLLKIERSVFEEQWRAADNWTLLAVPQQGSD
jgi:predicted double-glycine peptidase